MTSTSLFGADHTTSAGSDSWGIPAPRPRTSVRERVSGVLFGEHIPEQYEELFVNAKPENGIVELTELDKVIDRGGLDDISRRKIRSFVSSLTIDQNVWNVCMVLIGLAQRGEEDLDLDAVDFCKGNLPVLTLESSNNNNNHREGTNGHRRRSLESSGGSPNTAEGAFDPLGPASSSMGSPSSPSFGRGPLGNSTSVHSSDDVIGPAMSGGDEQTATPSSDTVANGGSTPWIQEIAYNPTAKDTIVVSISPEREGMFMFRHVVYVIEGTIQEEQFKVMRRYSNFLWLQECLMKRYPFRQLPVLPPKRLTVDGKYLSSDSYFLERRRRGLSRFVNQLVKHPLLCRDKLVSVFLTADDEKFNRYSKQIGSHVDEEFSGRVISREFTAKWDQQKEINKWRRIVDGVDRALECIGRTCTLADRIAKRQEAMATDHARMAKEFKDLAHHLPNVYFQMVDDVPVIAQGLRATAKYTDTSAALLKDESQSIDVGYLEELKQLRGFLVSMKELFVRYERYGGNRITDLQQRIDGNNQKINMLLSRPEAGTVGGGGGAGGESTNGMSGPANRIQNEVSKLRDAIARDNKMIEHQRNRDWLIKECINEEIMLFQKTQYQISRVVKDWSMDLVKYGELQSDNWSGLSGEVGDLP